MDNILQGNIPYNFIFSALKALHRLDCFWVGLVSILCGFAMFWILICKSNLQDNMPLNGHFM